jgi:hypothetical protein
LAGTPFILTGDAIEIFADVGIVPNV